MKNKFEENVASDHPGPQHTAEPALPWKVSEDDVQAPREATGSENISNNVLSRFRVRILLIVLLIITTFAFVSNTVTNIAIDKYEAEADYFQSAEQAMTLKASLIKTTDEKNMLSESTSELADQVNRLTAQKELYTAVLETIAKKDDPLLQPAKESQSLDTNEQ